MADEQEDTDAAIQDFILARELAEVYLLMDHISESPAKELPEIQNDPLFKNGKGTWLQQICQIAWPPKESSGAQDAHNAAKLIRAKDALNKAAEPATGGSIAFTIMVAGEARGPRDGRWWPRRRIGMDDANPSEPPTGNGGRGSGRGWPGGKPPSRASLAALAYPALARRAGRYRLGLLFLLAFLVSWLLVTCMVSWDVATGNSLLNRVTILNTQVTTLQSAAATPTPPPSAPPGGGAAPQAPVGRGAPPSGTASPSSEDLARAIELRAMAMDNLARWIDGTGRIRSFLLACMGGAGETTMARLPARPGAPATPLAALDETNAEWAQVLLGVLASNILPIFYGLLGAGALVVRTVSGRMRDSLLAPRDILLAYVQLALGAVIGACIGLFVNSEGSAGNAQAGLLGSVPLSASALCFVAGFGVEGVFQALESLVRRVFNLNPPRPAPTP